MAVNHADIVSALLALGRFDEAQKEVDSAPDDPAASWKTPLRLAVALDRKQYDAALTLLRQGTLIRDAPIFTLNYVAALQMAGQRDDAYREATKLVDRSPSCEGKAALAALKQERGDTSGARRLVAAALESADAADILPSALRCAALSAAAISDAKQAATLLERIAADEHMLRAWA